MRAPIASSAIAGDEEAAYSPPHGIARNFRAPVSRNRYEDVPMAAPEGEAPAEPTAPPSPTYDSLNPEQRAKVDRMIVALRLSKMRGIA